MPRLPAILLLTSISLTTFAADPANPLEKPEPPPVRKFYDVTDLVHAPEFTFAAQIAPPTDINTGPRVSGGGYMSGSGNSPPKPETTADRTDRLEKLIESTVEPAGWQDAGGSEASMTAYGTRLIVTARPATHAKLAELLDELRRHELRGVRLRLTWAALSDAELAAAIVPPAGGNQSTAATARTIDLRAIDKLANAVRHRAELNALNGRRVGLNAGRARTVLANVSAAVGNASAALEPSIDVVLAGVTFDAVPALSGDASTVTLDLRSIVGRWDAPDAPPIRIPAPVATTTAAAAAPIAAKAGRNDDDAPKIDRLNMPVHALTATVKIPTGRAILVGGMTGPTDNDDPRPLYLIVEAWGDPTTPSR
jgi:hypothetical protein